MENAPSAYGKALSQPERLPPTTKILLIEDNASDAILIRKILTGSKPSTDNIAFTEVARIHDALELLDTDTFDLILLDLNLLDSTGLLSVVSLHAETPDIPIVVYSGTNDPRLRQSAIMCGAKNFLIKGKEAPHTVKCAIYETLLYSKIRNGSLC